MNKKHLKILAVIFFILAAQNIIARIHAAHDSSHPVRHEEWHPFVPTDLVSRIVFSRAGFPELVLLKQNSEWKVASLSGVTADKQKVTALLTQLNQLKAELRAEGSDLYDRFMIGEKRAFHLQLFDATNKPVLDLWMSAKRSGQGVFIRLPGKTKIYSVADDLPALFGFYADLEQAAPLPIYFADLRLIPESFEQIQRFEFALIEDGKKVTTASLQRSSVEAGVAWKFISPTWRFKPSPEKVEDYLEHLAGAHAENVVAAGSSNVGFRSEAEMMLRDGRGKILRLQFSRIPGHGEPVRWLVRRADEAPVFEISDTVFQDIKADNSKLVSDNPLHLKIDESYTVELVENGKTETFSKTSGWPSAAALIDAAMKLNFLGVDPGAKSQDLSILPPTHILRILRPDEEDLEIQFYSTDPKLTEIKTVVVGHEPVFIVSKAYFDEIFVPATPPTKT